MKVKTCPGCKGTAKRGSGTCRYTEKRLESDLDDNKCNNGLIIDYSKEFLEIVEAVPFENYLLNNIQLKQDETIEVVFPNGAIGIHEVRYYASDDSHWEPFIFFEYKGVDAMVLLTKLKARRLSWKK